MGMKKGLAVLLVFGLLLMGVTPVLAAGEQVKAAATAQQGEAVQVVVPEGESLDEYELEETTGELAPQVWGTIIGAITGAVAGYRNAGWKGAAVGAFVGAATGFIATTVGPASGALIAELGRQTVYNPIAHGK